MSNAKEDWIWTKEEGVHNYVTGAHFNLDSGWSWDQLLAHYRQKTWWTPETEQHIVGLYQEHGPRNKYEPDGLQMRKLT